VVLQVEVRQDCRSWRVGKRLDVGLAKFGRYAIVSKEKRQSMPCISILETTNVLIGGRAGRGRTNAGTRDGPPRCGGGA
jgi:hypothetical protein